MDRLRPYFRIHFNDKFMTAELDCSDDFLELEETIKVEEEVWKKFLSSQNINFGIQYQILDQLASDPQKIEYPVTIAKGLPPKKGEDGKIVFFVDLNPEMNRDEDWDFREVMKIPSVTKGQKLAKLIMPTSGTDGRNVKGEIVKAIPGKMAVLRPGKNIVYHEESQTYFAAEDGQISYTGRKIQVLPVYHVNETLSLKTGNLDFVGTIIIHGDVPSGFKVKALGDVKVFGLVEAAEVTAGGSIYISEGISGQGKGILRARENLQIGYINQGNVFVGNDLYVENSILHSYCEVEGHVYSQRGNIIGGKLLAGKSIEAKDIGNRLSTKTEIALGVNKAMLEKESSLNNRKNELEEMIKKLSLLGKKLEEQINSNPKVKVHLLRQKHSLSVATEELEEVKDELARLNEKIVNLSKAELIVRNYIYQNSIVSFGKYQRIVKNNYHYVKMYLDDKEIVLEGMDTYER